MSFISRCRYHDALVRIYFLLNMWFRETQSCNAVPVGGCSSPIFLQGQIHIIIFSPGFPLLTHFLVKKQTNQGGFNLGGTNATGQVPNITGNYGLIDRDTPVSAMTKKSYTSGEDFVLVFSDEFNTDGRTFYPGDDPFWEAVDFHYWGTVAIFVFSFFSVWMLRIRFLVQNDLEWYDVNQRWSISCYWLPFISYAPPFFLFIYLKATTRGGSLRLTLENVANPLNNHNLSYRSGMVCC